MAAFDPAALWRAEQAVVACNAHAEWAVLFGRSAEDPGARAAFLRHLLVLGRHHARLQAALIRFRAATVVGRRRGLLHHLPDRDLAGIAPRPVPAC